jgi:hypothetical protein
VTPDFWSAPFSFADILGDSVALQNAKRLGRTTAESGYPFVAINCGTQSDVPRHPADVMGP